MQSQIHVLYPKRAMLSGNPVASQSLTVSTVAVAFTGFTASTAVGGVDLVTFDIGATGDLRCRWDGTDPISTSGHTLPASTAYTWDVDQFNATKFIRDSTSTADVVIFASSMQA